MLIVNFHSEISNSKVYMDSQYCPNWLDKGEADKLFEDLSRIGESIRLAIDISSSSPFSHMNLAIPIALGR
jgi:Zn-finger nucleic acid-binding protein